MAELAVLSDGTIRYSDGTGNVIQFPRSSWSGNASNVRTQIINWLSANKLSGWTVTVSSIGTPPNISITSAPVRMP